MKCSSEMLQNLPYFWNMRTYVGFFILCYFIFPPNECPDLCRYRPRACIREANKVARNEKRKKNYMSFDIPKIWQILKHFTGTFHQA